MSEQSDHDRRRYADDPDYRERRLASINAWRDANKDEINARRRLRWATDPEYRERQLAPYRGGYWRARDLMRHYGITLADYNARVAEQKGRCAICKRKPREPLQVDHCHRRKRVRRLLCGSCNRGLGHFRDDPRLLRGAAAYVVAESRPRRGGKARVKRRPAGTPCRPTIRR
jgi:hypothetical protein